MRAENINYETTEDEDLGRGVCSNVVKSSLSGDWSGSEDSLPIPPISITAESEGADDGPEVFPIESTSIAFDDRCMACPLTKPNDIINLDTVSVLETGSSVDLKKLIKISNEILLYVRSIDDRLRKIEKNPVIVPNKEKESVIESFLPITSIVEMQNFEQFIEDKINLQHFNSVGDRESLQSSPATTPEPGRIKKKRVHSSTSGADAAIIDVLKTINAPPPTQSDNINPICRRISDVLNVMPQRERTMLEITLMQTVYDAAKDYM
ncbi:hypothetical protein RN001_014633 [Aquatica leii]|uniref:Uncharacterized protein n=1 Tax=Aquatica leii TaxID=1421715 RepID=A0AAN7NY96_9COLE|nr:hypothetical protein RN001_014633 [Aquatica leii]